MAHDAPIMSDNQAHVTYSQLRTQGRRPLADQLPLARPLSVYLEPTNVCNFKCRQCPESLANYQEIAGGYAGMPWELYEKIVADFEAIGGLISLKLYLLGEPMVNRRLPDMIRLAKQRGVCERVEVTSNGTLLDEKMARALIESGLDYLRISIYSVDQARHEHVTQSKARVDRIRENLIAFQRLKRELGATAPLLYVKMIHPFTAEAEAFTAMYRDVADEVQLELPMNWNGEADFVGALYGDQAVERLDAGPAKAVCPFPFYSLVINAQGRVGACCVDWSMHTELGDLRTESLVDVWHGEKLRAFRRMHLERRRAENATCRSCTFLNTAPDDLDAVPPAAFERLLAAAPTPRP